MTDTRTLLKLKPGYSDKLSRLQPHYRARSKAHLLEILIDDAELRIHKRQTGAKPPQDSDIPLGGREGVGHQD